MKVKVLGSFYKCPNWTKWIAIDPYCSSYTCKIVAYSTRPMVNHEGYGWQQSNALLENRAKVLGTAEKPQGEDWRDCLWHISEDPEMGPETYYLNLPGPTQPAFENVPRWTTRVAQNADGVWWAFENEPTKVRYQGQHGALGHWKHNGGRRTVLGVCAIKTIWSKQIYAVTPPPGLYIIPEQILRRPTLRSIAA